MDKYGTGRVAVVTGGSRGIGRGIVLGLHRLGFKVLVNYHSDARQAAALINELESDGGTAFAVQASASEADFGKRLFDAAEERLGPVDILINNAGMLVAETVGQMKRETFEKVIATNLYGTFSTASQAAIRMRTGGRVINLSSSALHTSRSGNAAYNAAKAGVEALSKVLAKELAHRNITVNAVAPGPTETELFFRGKDQRTIDQMKEACPAGRLGLVEDIVPAVLFLCRPDAAWVNGQTIRVNGGAN